MSADYYGECPKCHHEDETYREHREIGIRDNGEFFVDFHGWCENEKCNFEYMFDRVLEVIELHA